MSLPKYPEYKDSGVSWLGEVPAHWDVCRLKSKLSLRTEKAERRIFPVALENIEGWTGRYLETETEFQGEGVSFDSGDILFGKLRPYLAKVLLAQCAGEAVGDFHVLRPSSDIVGRYAQYQMLARNFIDFVNGETFGSKMPRASWDSLGGMPFVSPSPSEQVKIATFLDRETAKIDALIAEQEKLIALLAEKRQATISHAVTRGLDPNVPLKDSGVPWLGKVPAHWEIKPLRYCVDYQEGPGILAEDFRDEGIPLLRVAGVQSNLATLDGCNFLDPDKVSIRWNHFRLLKGDLLVSASASMGTVCEVGDDAVGAVAYTGIIRLREKEGVMIRDFIRYMVVSWPFLSQIDLLKAGATIQHYGPTHLSQMFAVCPPVKEQESISDFIANELARAGRLMQEAKKTVALLHERRAALISAAVTGKIDVRGLAA